MTITEQISADFITAFKAKEMTKKNFLGVLKGSIQTLASKLGKKGLDPSDDEAVLNKVLEPMKVSINEMIKVGDESAVEEMTFLKPYLPTLMSEEDIRTNVKQILNDTGEANMGKVMGEFNKKYKGQADGKVVSTIVLEELA